MSKQVLRLPPQRPSTPGGAATGPRWWATRRAAGAAVVTFALLGGCGGSPAAENTSSAPPVTATPTERTAADDAFAEFPMTFAAGDSATWSTSLLIDKKGRFSGSFRSLDTTPAGAEYPNGTETVCAFEGRFTEVEQVDAHEYTMKVKGFIITSQPVASPTSPGRRNPRPQITVDTGINTIYCERDNPPSGFVNTKEFRLYLPGKAVADLPADYVGMAFAAGAPAGEMTFYGLYNAGDQAAFRG